MPVSHCHSYYEISTLPVVFKIALFLKLSADVRLEETSVPGLTRASASMI